MQDEHSGRRDDDIKPDYRIPDEPEPWASEGEPIAWMADSTTHLSDVEPQEPPHVDLEGPLPVCDYTADADEPCEEPAVERRWSSFSVILSATLGAVFGGLLVAAAAAWAFGYVPGTQPLVSATRGGADSTVRTAMSTPSVTIQGNQNLDAAVPVADKVTPAVVNVAIEQQAVDPFTGSSVNQEAGNGSGVMIRSDGYILTNNHVVDGADRIVVTVGVEDKVARVVGTDPSTDLAVIKIDGTGYPAIEVGSSKGLKVGEFVVAVGSPFGLEKTVTSGIISALQRSELIQGQNDLTTYTNLIQTDAAINPGNSGGALVNQRGQLIGINTLIQSPSGSSAGIGFAIPVDLATNIAEQLITDGRATHPYLGVSTETIDQAIATQFNLPVEHGVLVRFVQPGSPAEKAGLQRDDIIVQIGETRITSVEDVFAAVRSANVGSSVPVEVVRGDTKLKLTAALASDRDRQ